QMASPLSKNLIAGAIGESGAMIKPTLPAILLAEGEKNGLAFAEKAGAKSLADLRAMPAAQLLDAAAKPGAFRPASRRMCRCWWDGIRPKCLTRHLPGAICPHPKIMLRKYNSSSAQTPMK